MRADLLHLLRNLRRSPASAGAAVLTLSLTLGIGAAIFAVVDAVLLTPPPFANPDALVFVGEVPIDDAAAAPRAVGYATFDAWRQRAEPIATMEAFDGTNLTLTEIGAAERVSACYATPGFLTLLGVAPAIGRAFRDDDVAQRVAIVSNGFWRSKLAMDANPIGRQIVLGGQAHTIVGVLPNTFSFALGASDVWLPFQAGPAQAARAGYRVLPLARLRPYANVSDVEQALAEVSRTSSPPARVVATPVATAIAGDATRTLGVLSGAAAVAALIAFTNLAGLLIVRSIDRRRELAVRSALGAPRSTIARLLLLEAAALVAMGVVGGVLLALSITPAVARLALEQFGASANRDIVISWRTVAVISLVAAASTALCGSLPALMAARRNVVEVLRRGATPAPRELALRRVFVTGVVALAFVLVVSVTVLGRSLFSVLRVHPGFEASGVLTLQVALPSASYNRDRVVEFYSALQSAVAQRLGPQAVSYIDEIPLTGDRGRTVASLRQTDEGREAVLRAVATGYFDVMRVPVVAGRGFEPRDNASAPPRVVVSESVAQRLFAAEPPIGRQVWLTATRQMAEIIGVVGDVKHRALDETTAPTVYLSALQAPSHGSIVVVRSSLPDADAIAAVREEVGRLDRNLPVYGTRPMLAVVAASPGVPARRVLTATFLGFALLAVVLGAIGLFGVVAHDVACRRTELALRIALGADASRLLRATLGQGAWMVGSGLMAGGLLSFWAARALGNVLVTADHWDALSIGGAALVLIIAGTPAVLPAAVRAARTDPLVALRAE